MLDVFYMTFNAEKEYISVPKFGSHFYKAFNQNSNVLPELVVFALQEMAPLSTAFIGSYFLNPYFTRFEAALNLAAAKFAATHGLEAATDRTYTLVRTANVGMTGIMLFTRDTEAVVTVQSAEVGFGAGDMANKGAVGLRAVYNKEGKQTEMTFVSTHLAAMEWNLERRNHNWQSIVSGLVFSNPKTVLRSNPEVQAEGEEQEPLLSSTDAEQALRDISIYKPGSHLFVAGDLNYRISKTSPPTDTIQVFPVLSPPDAENYYPRFLSRDQLAAEKAAGRTLHGLTEAPIKFPPTYKYVMFPESSQTELAQIGVEEDDHDEIPAVFAKHRWPSWCDRVLYLDIPPWVPGRGTKQMYVTAYNCLPLVRTSDHRAVFLRIQVPVLTNAELQPPPDAGVVLGPGGLIDPRLKLPFPVDVESWDHRMTVKRWEVLLGWSMMVSKSKQGIMVFTTMLLVGLGAWWYRRYFSST
ncbi:Endonuclease/exonuclease/phosphatase [Xylariales sp. PMI_506]|nr:Endonuclease/exonuclease/phosphatase [Xylariales sp. PMI_506]